MRAVTRPISNREEGLGVWCRTTGWIAHESRAIHAQIGVGEALGGRGSALAADASWVGHGRAAPRLRSGLRLLPPLLLVLLVSCGAPPRPEPRASPPPEITGIDAPRPILEGTIVRVTGISLDRTGLDPVLRVSSGASRFELASVPHGVPGERLFAVSSALLDELGAGMHEVSLEIEGAGVLSESYLDRWELATELALSLEAAPSGDVHRNDVAVLRGSGFAAEGEADSEACFTGTFTREGGGSSAVDACLPIALLERTARDRAVVILSSAIGGIHPGTFEGAMRVRSTLRGGAVRHVDPIPTALRFGRPELYSFSPEIASLGQWIAVRGAGFLGGTSETTVLRVEGTFTPRGGSATAFAAEDLFPRFVSGAEVRLAIEAEASGTTLVARLFGAARGSFAGTATPITIAGTDEVAGDRVPFTFTLGPIVQVVHLRFLPGFYASLDRFGLGSAAGRIEEAIVQRIEGIYAGYNLDLRLEEPDDFDPRAYSVIEIGGPDPNGNGLFGYDNSPGKDTGNVRLFDRIGGANAQTQMDGFPGYGGVFVESLLFWSSHPDLPFARPPSSPDPDPLFDELFDPVRLEPATLAEIQGSGDPARVAEVARALEALASIVGETAAHELGHSLGMAQPYGPPTAFHSAIDGDGCLMDRGGDRPLAERAQQRGAARTTFCGDETRYLEEILGN